jgi:photoactive yellow protein
MPCYAQRIRTASVDEIVELMTNRIEDLPIGRILLDGDMRITGYNEDEARLTGLDAERVLGKLFFEEVAPCLDTREIGEWCREHVDSPEPQTTVVEWVLELKRGRHPATLHILSGEGRVLIQVDAEPAT